MDLLEEFDEKYKRDPKTFARMLEERTALLAVRIIRLSAKLPKDTEGKVVKNKHTKAGTSIGANYREANRARSRADFRSKINICESESSETVYWLEIIRLLQWIKEKDLMEEYDEATQLLALFTKISKTTHDNLKRKD